MASNREVRRVKGKDPVLDVAAYQQWEQSLPIQCKSDKKSIILNSICEKTLVEIENKGSNIPNSAILASELNICVTSLRDYLRKLVQEGYIARTGDGNAVRYRATVNGLAHYFATK